ncbi:MAG TPA: TRAP transporter large permease [Firmicutes bacterium]|nr:TRAP transporter large permease [Bacillota bacterium]
MDPILVGIIGTIVALILLSIGMPIALALMLTGFLGIWHLSSLSAALPVAARTLYAVTSQYAYMVIPLFLLMGSFAAYSGLIEDLYSMFDKWLRKFPGGLSAATIAACAGFSAVSGSAVATAAAMGSIAYPEMKKFNYSSRLATGTIAAGGTLGFLIPPSIGFVVYGMLVEESIGRLFMAGIFPGLALAATFIAIIALQVRFKPDLAPANPGKVSWKEKLVALRGVWEILAVFFIVMGGIYLGWFSPSEAGAIGATLFFIVVLVKKKMTFKKLYEGMLESVRVSVMVLFLVAGATVFTYFLALSTIPAHLAHWVVGLQVSRYIILVIILLVYFFLGCFIDAISMMVLTLPVIFPLILKLGFDPIYFGVVCVLMMQVGLITPPMGLNLYTIAGSAKDVPLEDIFAGALPFVIPILVVVVLITIFPEIALYLPDKMFR